MPDAFFATNKNRKRKRSTGAADQGPSTSKKPARGSAAPRGKKATSGPTNGRSKRAPRDEELSDETSEGDGDVDELDLRAPDVDPDAYESGDEVEDETPAEKRLRLAKLYLESVKQDLADGEYDAAEIDREIISSRLKQDVMEHSGKVHLFIADNYDFSNPPTLRTRGHRFSATAAAATEDARWLFTSGKDGCIIKWDLRTGKKLHMFHKVRPAKDVGKGKGKAKAEPAGELKGHTDEIWAIALSPDGKLLASGGKDRRIGVWSIEKDEWVKGFGGHRDSISSLAFRKAPSTSTSTVPSQLYTGSFDRSLKLFDLSPGTMGYVETLFGHQAPVLDIDTLMRETAVSVGGRDKSVRYWKVPEESQLVFRGGGKSGWEDILEGAADEMEVDGSKKAKKGKTAEKFIEGSVECVAMIDENTFVSGGDSGSICLWTTQKKKPIFTQALAHGMDESQVETEDMEVVRKPRWITSLGALRYSDLFASGSWDGEIRLWKLDSKLRSFTLVGSIHALGVVNTIQFLSLSRDQIKEYPWANSSDAPQTNGHAPVTAKPLLVVAGVGKETKFGRWVEKRDAGVLNGSLVVALHPRTLR